MPFFVKGTALKQLCLLFSLQTAKTDITEAQLYACVFHCCKMDWFSFSEELPTALEEGLVAEVPRAFGQCLRLTPKGEKALELFTDAIPLSTRTSVESYMEEHRAAFNREKQMVSSLEPMEDGGELLTLKALDGELTVMEIKLSLASKEQGLLMRSNWEVSCPELYGFIWNRLSSPHNNNKD